MAKLKKRFPSAKARFCTEHLKIRPMIDYILDEVKTHIIVIQGIRADESISRSKMKASCTYFRFYLEPYGFDTKGNPKLHTYRKKEVLAFVSRYMDDVERPVFKWSAEEVLNYILDNGLKPNPLYYKGFARVGCMPCVMSNHNEVRQMIKHFPEHIKKLDQSEKLVGSTFFAPRYIPERFCTLIYKAGKKLSSIKNVINYLTNHKRKSHENRNEQQENSRCMSFYHICE